MTLLKRTLRFKSFVDFSSVGRNSVLGVCLALIIGASALAQESHREHEILARQLTGRNAMVRQQTLARVVANPELALEALPTLVTTAEVEVAKLGPNDSVPFHLDGLLHLVGTVGEPDGDRMLVEMLDNENYRVAMTAADSLGQNHRQETIEFLKRQVDRPVFSSHYGFRFNLVRALSRMRHPDAVEFLTEMESGIDGQLQFEIKLILAEVTDEHFLGDQGRYLRWKASRKSNVEIQYASYELQPDSEMPQPKPQTHYGIDIHAKRILFVIDRSSSMEKNSGEMTRLERAKVELSKVIESLPNDNKFGIVLFEDAVLTWKDHLLPATQANKNAAMEFVHRFGYGNRTNTYGALRESLRFDDQLEIVFFLSDGRPTFGEIIRPQWIVNDIMERNRLRNIQLNTIGISVGGESERFLRALAKRSNGEFRRAD